MILYAEWYICTLNLSFSAGSNKQVSIEKEKHMYRIILFMLLATGIVFGQHRSLNGHNPFLPKDRQERIVKKLDLKEDQLKQYKTFRSQLRKDQIASRAKIQTLRIELRDLFDSPKPDKTAIEAKVGEVSTLQSEMKMKMVAFWFDVNNILTAEQQKIWKRAPREFLREGGKMMMRGMRNHFGMLDTPGPPDQIGDEENSEDNE
jgi:Spy/CpxP family protein refolding chaperone